MTYDVGVCDLCGKRATCLWRAEVPVPLEAGDTYVRYELGKQLHRGCDEHRPNWKVTP